MSLFIRDTAVRHLPLTQGKFAIVDADMFEELSQFKWFYNSGYAVRKLPKTAGKRRTLKMHRLVHNTPEGYETDHINGDKLDNRRENLRTATHSENQCNTAARATSTTGFKGVYLYKRVHKHVTTYRYRATISKHGKRAYLGIFTTASEAARCYQEAAKSIHGEFAR